MNPLEILIHAVEKLATEEGEEWRLKHPELMDALQAAQEYTEEYVV